MDYWDWVQDQICLANWLELVRLTEELGLYEHQRIGDKQLSKMPEGMGSDE